MRWRGKIESDYHEPMYKEIIVSYLKRKYGIVKIPNGLTAKDIAKEILTEAINNTPFDKPERRDELLKVVKSFEDN